MRAPFAASTTADVLVPAGGDREQASASSIAADAWLACQRKKGAGPAMAGGVFPVPDGCENRELHTTAGVLIAAEGRPKKTAAFATEADALMVAGATTTAGTEPGNRRVSRLNLILPAAPRSEYFCEFGDWWRVSCIAGGVGQG